MTNKVLELIKRQIKLLNYREEYQNIKIYVSDERQFIKNNIKEDNAIYLIVKFGEGTLNYGATFLPITIEAITVQNKIELCKQFLFDYTQTYNLVSSNNIMQSYTTPTNTIDFIEMFVGYRSLFEISAVFLIAQNSNTFNFEYFNDKGEWEKIEAIDMKLSFSNQLDSQPFFNTNNFAKSETRVSVLALTFVKYLNEDEIDNKIFDIVYKKIPNTKSFKIKIIHENGKEYIDDFKLLEVVTEKSIGLLQEYIATFTL